MKSLARESRVHASTGRCNAAEIVTALEPWHLVKVTDIDTVHAAAKLLKTELHNSL